MIGQRGPVAFVGPCSLNTGICEIIINDVIFVVTVYGSYKVIRQAWKVGHKFIADRRTINQNKNQQTKRLTIKSINECESLKANLVSLYCSGYMSNKIITVRSDSANRSLLFGPA